MKTKICMIMVTLVIVLGLSGCEENQVDDNKVNQIEENQGKEDKKEDVKEMVYITASNLAKEYNDDKLKAADKYEGYPIEVSGVIDAHGFWTHLHDATMAVKLVSDYEEFANFYTLCKFNDEKELERIYENKYLYDGDEIVVQGVIGRESQNGIHIEDCKLISVNGEPVK